MAIEYPLELPSNAPVGGALLQVSPDAVVACRTSTFTPVEAQLTSISVSGVVRSLSVGGSGWSGRYTFNPMRRQQYLEWRAFFRSLRGQLGTFNAIDFGHVQSGTIDAYPSAIIPFITALDTVRLEGKGPGVIRSYELAITGDPTANFAIGGTNDGDIEFPEGVHNVLKNFTISTQSVPERVTQLVFITGSRTLTDGSIEFGANNDVLGSLPVTTFSYNGSSHHVREIIYVTASDGGERTLRVSISGLLELNPDAYVSVPSIFSIADALQSNPNTEYSGSSNGTDSKGFYFLQGSYRVEGSGLGGMYEGGPTSLSIGGIDVPIAGFQIRSYTGNRDSFVRLFFTNKQAARVNFTENDEYLVQNATVVNGTAMTNRGSSDGFTEYEAASPDHLLIGSRPFAIIRVRQTTYTWSGNAAPAENPLGPSGTNNTLTIACCFVSQVVALFNQSVNFPSLTSNYIFTFSNGLALVATDAVMDTSSHLLTWSGDAVAGYTSPFLSLGILKETETLQYTTPFAVLPVPENTLEPADRFVLSGRVYEVLARVSDTNGFLVVTFTPSLDTLPSDVTFARSPLVVRARLSTSFPVIAIENPSGYLWQYPAVNWVEDI